MGWIPSFGVAVARAWRKRRKRMLVGNLSRRSARLNRRVTFPLVQRRADLAGEDQVVGGVVVPQLLPVPALAITLRLPASALPRSAR